MEIKTFKIPISVLVVIHTPAMEILLLERAAHPGYWQSVTGSREEGEDLQATAWRELYEETGLTAEEGMLHDWQQSQVFEIFPEWRHRYAPGVTHNTEHVFSYTLPEKCKIILSEEHSHYRWLPQQEAADLCFSWSNRDAILALHTTVFE